MQWYLPLNPQGLVRACRRRWKAFNTAASFTTNTNWQAYGGESTMSYLTQMAGLAFHNFVSAAAGIAVAIAIVRGFARRTAKTLGNFWFDLTRATLWVLLPISIVFALVLDLAGRAGEFQRLYAGEDRRGRRPGNSPEEPVASQEIIKNLGTNGGGFVNANSSPPNENPTP